MMNVCPVCGKYHCIHWPEYWVYRRGNTYYCSEMCMDVSIVKDTKQMNIAKARRKARIMEKLKKDGTPAKKPGPKKKSNAELPLDIKGKKGLSPLTVSPKESEQLRKAFVPNQINTDISTMEKEMEIRQKLVTTAVSHPTLGEFYYDRKYKSIDWRAPDGTEVSLGPVWWKDLIEDMPGIMKVLGVQFETLQPDDDNSGGTL